MNLILAEGAAVGQWILLGVLLLILILAPIFMSFKNKKEMAHTQNMLDALKKGDTILTSAGVIGKIVGIENKDGYKTLVIETGDEKHKGYMAIDIASVYYNLSNPPQEDKKEEVKTEAVEKVKEEVATETTEEVKVEEAKLSENKEEAKEEVKEEKKASTKKKTTKKSK